MLFLAFCMSKGNKMSKIPEKPIDEFAKESLIEYGSYTVEERAVPDYRDGLKPVHRRILWSMHKIGVTPNSSTKKCARIIGEVLGKYHPHGDAAAYGALVGMVNLPTPLIFGQGNFGFLGSPPAAMRYTECRLTPYAQKVMFDEKYLAVSKYVKNYDGSEEEPVLLPALLPNILFNGSYGIAVGVTTGISQYAPKGIIDLLKIGFKEPITAKLCAKHLKPITRFGGNLGDDKEALRKEAIEYYKTGAGQLAFKPDYTVNGNIIHITGLPVFTINYDIAGLVKDLQEFDFVAEVNNFSNVKKGVDIKVRLKRISDVKDESEAITKVIKTATPRPFTLKTNVTIRQFEKRPDFKASTIPDLLNEWIKWRVELEVAAQKYIAEKIEKDIHYHEVLVYACSKLDIIFKILKSGAKEDAELESKLAKALKISNEDANIILSLQVRKLSRLNEEKEKKTIKELKEKLKTAKGFIKKPKEACLINLANLEKLF